MRDQHDGQAFRMQLAQQRHDFRAALGIEISGRFIGQDDGRAGARARARWPRAAAARRKARWACGGCAAPRPTRSSRSVGLAEGRVALGVDKRQLDVVERGHALEQMELLEDEADGFRAELAKFRRRATAPCRGPRCEACRCRAGRAGRSCGAASICPSPTRR